MLLTDAAVLTACRAGGGGGGGDSGGVGRGGDYGDGGAGGGGGGGGVGSSGAGLCVPRGQTTVASEALLAGGFALALLLAWLFGGHHTTSPAGA